MKQNICTPFYEPGGRLTGKAEGAAVIGKRFLVPAADRTSGPEIPAGAQIGASDPTEGGVYQIKHAVAGGPSCGVSSYDVAEDGLVPIIGVPGAIVPIEAGADIDAAELVMVGAGGVAMPYDAGEFAANGNAQQIDLSTPVIVGLCMNGAANGDDAEIKLLV